MQNIEFKHGDAVILDKGKGNSSVVFVVEQTPKRIYTIVTDKINTWTVMTYRLTIK